MPSKTESNKKINLFNSKITMIVAVLFIWALFTILTGGSFLGSRNLSNLFRQMTTTGILAIGMLFVVIAGEIDLSVGSLMGLFAGVLAVLNVTHKVDGYVAIIITLVLGLLLGLWQGWWVAYKKVPSFIATLAGMLAFRGVLMGITNGNTVGPLSSQFTFFGQDYLAKPVGYIVGIIAIIAVIFSIMKKRKIKEQYHLAVPSVKVDMIKAVGFSALIALFICIFNAYQGIPVPVLILTIIAIIFNFVASKTIYGRKVYAIGGNVDASKLSGINVNKTKLLIFVINGLLAAVAGILLASRLNAASNDLGQGAEMDAIASCVIGGASLSGGSGSIIGALVGALVMASLDNGMSILNIQPFWQYIVKGLILLLAVYADIVSKKKE